MESDTENEEQSALARWLASTPSPNDWLREGLALGLEFSKGEKFYDAEKVYEEVLRRYPRSERGLNGKLYNIYRHKVKSGNREEMLSAAEYIVSHSNQFERFTPYTYTILRVVESLLNKDPSDVELADSWLRKLNPHLLENKTMGSEKTYWSQLRKYFQVKSAIEARLCLRPASIWSLLCLMRYCESSHEQLKTVLEWLWDESASRHEPLFVDLINTLLLKRGFSGSDWRSKYREALYRRYAFRETEWEEFKEENAHKSEMKIVSLLEEELLAPDFENIRTNVHQQRTYRATDLASFSFCPASYSIASSFLFESAKLVKTGEELHEEQHLLGKEQERVRNEFVQYAGSMGRKTFWLTSQPGDSGKEDIYRDLLEDVSSARIVHTGHGEDKPEVFLSPDKSIAGCPDYVFEKPDGTRFVVEEKFSRFNENRSLEQPYNNHRVQLASYIYALEELNLAYGYILYWFHQEERVETGEGPPSRISSVVGALAFRVDRSDGLHALASRITDQVRHFVESGSMHFEKTRLDPRKCIGCSVSRYCMHKTGTLDVLGFPYPNFHPKNLLDEPGNPADDNVGLTFKEAAKIAKARGGKVVRIGDGRFMAK